MKRILMSLALILFLMGCALALDFENGVEMRPGERVAERLFEKGIGQPWVGGDPPSFNSWGGFTPSDRPSRIWNWWYDPFFYRGADYYRYSSPCKDWHPFYYNGFDYYHPDCDCYPYTHHTGYRWS